MTQYIKAPFNFVPVSEKVFFPDWADQISHDIPFSDGESGELELTITAHSPIFVRNGHTKKDADDKENSMGYKSFSRIGEDGYFIPATSIKGAIRNVLEIMSFGKMKIDKQMKFSTREWDNPNIYDLKGSQKNIHCGWLTQSNGRYQIKDCGKPDRINHKRIDEYLNSKRIPIQFETKFAETSNFDLNQEKTPHGGKDFNPKTAAYKYALIDNELKLISGLYFTEDEKYKAKYQENRVKVSSSRTDQLGTIVFTGSPNPWKQKRDKDSGKFYEFVFPDIEGKNFPISDVVFNYFKFIYTDSEDWKFWKDKVESGGKMPVFFRLDSSGQNVKDFGLAFLYKLPFEKSPYELLSENHKYDDKSEKPYKPDLAECILGYTTKKSSLKGRVQFGHALVKGKAILEPEVELVLGSPKPSYYPIYVEQKEGNGKVAQYNIYSSGKHISGWKRYPIRGKVWNNKSVDNTDLNSKFFPLAEGTTFKSAIRFHNLRKEEIGALLSALTFHNNEGKFYHQLGLAKPYGYGNVSISVTPNSPLKLSLDEYMMAFEEAIVEDKEMFGGKIHWHDSDEISQLFTMATDFDSKTDNLLKYMKMDTDRSKNEFLLAKSNDFMEYLERYTLLSKESLHPQSLYKSIKVQKELEEQARKEAIENEKREALLKRIELAKQMEEEERVQRKKANQHKALSEGFSTNITNFSKRDSWEKLRKEVERFACFVHMDNNYSRILKKCPDGVIPAQDHEAITKIVLAIYNESIQKEQEEWTKPLVTNRHFKCITEWIGKDNSQNLFNKLLMK